MNEEILSGNDRNDTDDDYHDGGATAEDFRDSSSSSGSSNSNSGERGTDSGTSGTTSGDSTTDSGSSSSGNGSTVSENGTVGSGFDESFLRSLQFKSDDRGGTSGTRSTAYSGGRTETARRSGAQEGTEFLGDILSGQIPLNVKLGDLDDAEGVTELKLPKIRLVIASCLFYGLGVFKSAPGNSFWRRLVLNEREALILGDVWTNWIESQPSRKKSAITSTISKAAPSFTAFAVTVRVFLPRIFAGRIQNLMPPLGEDRGGNIDEQQRILLIQQQIEAKRREMAAAQPTVENRPSNEQAARAAIIEANNDLEI